MIGPHPLAGFVEQVRTQPRSCAVVDGDRIITYEELGQRAASTAGLLLERGVQPGDRVAVFVPKSIEAVATFLGCLMIRAPWVPIDLASPVARTARMMTVAFPRAAVVHGKGLDLFRSVTSEAEGWAPAAVDLDSLNVDLETPVTLESHVPDIEGLAHVLFTSGSTGQPKGVAVEVANVAHFINWATEYFDIGPGDRLSGHTPFHFDLSTFDVLGPLSVGAELHLVPPALNLLPHKLVAWIRDQGLTHWFSVPTVLGQWIQSDVVADGDFESMSHLLWCGEAIATPVLRRLMARLPHVKFTNLYGPTETTIASSVFQVPEIPSSDLDPVPIGSGISGEFLSIRDQDGVELGPSEKGEICISGDGVTDGYWNDLERTESVFVDLPAASLTDVSPSRGTELTYRTGDVGYHSDGLFYVLGRLDNQIKFRGHRIELGEIETALYSLPDVAQVAVVFPKVERPVIAAAVVGLVGYDQTITRKLLAEIVPGYMVPGSWKLVDRLPTNANGKVDRGVVCSWFEEGPE